MATKKEVEELNAEIARLKEVLWQSEQDVAKLRSIENTLNSKIFFLEETNKFLASERDRSLKSDNIHMQMNYNLMRAIASLGEKQLKQDNDEIWHSCRGPRYSQMEATDAQKPL